MGLPGSAQDYHGLTYAGPQSLDAYVEEVTRGSVHLEGALRPDGDVFGPVIVQHPARGRCDTSDLVRQARAALPALDPDRYDSVLYTFPEDAGCEFGGYYDGHSIYLPLSSLRYFVGTAAHELGHALGIDHACQYLCESPTGIETHAPLLPGSTCRLVDYGDPFDVMGRSIFEHHYHVDFKRQLGILASHNTRTWGGHDATYVLRSARDTSSGVQIVRIPGAQAHPQLGDSYYFLEFGAPYRRDDPAALLASGVLVRRGGARSGLLDATPQTPDAEDAALTEGRTLTLPDVGVRIRVLRVHYDAAEIALEAVADAQPPRLSRFSATSLGPNTTLVSWLADEPALYAIEYGASSVVERRQDLSRRTAGPVWTLLTGLEPGVHLYRVTAVDEAGNRVTQTPRLFVVP